MLCVTQTHKHIYYTLAYHTHTHTYTYTGESQMGPVVKQIMDHPRCAQLREGDVILEINGENVRNYVHSDLVTVLKRCSKGNQANFNVLREPPMPQVVITTVFVYINDIMLA